MVTGHHLFSLVKSHTCHANLFEYHAYSESARHPSRWETTVFAIKPPDQTQPPDRHSTPLNPLNVPLVT